MVARMGVWLVDLLAGKMAEQMVVRWEFQMDELSVEEMVDLTVEHLANQLVLLMAAMMVENLAASMEFQWVGWLAEKSVVSMENL